MKRSKRWNAPNNPTTQAKQVWVHLFPGEPWPKGWRVAWAGFMRGALGLCVYREKRILLSYGDAKKNGCVETLVHEFVHMRCGHSLRHGREFKCLEQSMLARIGLEKKDQVTLQ